MPSRRLIRFIVPGVPIADQRPRSRVQWPNRAAFATAFRAHKDPAEFFQWLVKTAFVQTYIAGKTAPWRAKVAAVAKEHRDEEPWAGPIRCNLHFALPRPTGHYSKSHKKVGRLVPTAPIGAHAKKPDLDNLVKVVYDGITDSGLWVDDRLVCDGRLTKAWVQEDRQPALMVELHHLVEEKHG